MTDYTTDIVAFLRDLVPVEGDYGPQAVIPSYLETWLYTAFPLPDGNPAARDILDSRSKKQGKSSTAGAVALYLAARRRSSEVVIVAADKDQAKDRVFRSVVYAVEHHPAWGKAKVFKDVIELDNGSTITVLAYDWKGAAGGNQSGVIMDELHTFTAEGQRRLFDELVIPPTQKNGVRWIASYAGFEGESTLLQEIWNRAKSGERLAGELPIYHAAESSLLALIDQGKESWRMPWSTAAAMRQIEASERPSTFRRLWLNEWVSSESQFLPEGVWNGLYNPDVLPLLPGDKRPIVLGADASTSRDLTALVGVTFDPLTHRADVVYCRVWKPKFSLLRAKATIDLSATVGAEIARLHKENRVRAVYYDPYQLHSISIDLQKSGVKMVELPQTGARVESDQNLYDACIGGAIHHYNDPTLNEHVQNAIALETARGFRLAKEKTTRKIDAAVALSMAHYGALQQLKAIGEAETFPNIFYQWDYAQPDDFVQAGGQWVYAPERLRTAHKPGVNWRNCRARSRGCEACILEMELEGVYESDQLMDEARAVSWLTQQTAAEQDYQMIMGQRMAQEQKTDDFLREFWANARRK